MSIRKDQAQLTNDELQNLWNKLYDALTKAAYYSMPIIPCEECGDDLSAFEFLISWNWRRKLCLDCMAIEEWINR